MARVIITHYIKAEWYKVCSKPNILKRYFTKTRYGMTTCGADDRLILPKKFSYSKYSLGYVTEQPVITHIKLHKLITEPHHGQETFVTTLADDMVDGLDHADGIIYYDL